MDPGSRMKRLIHRLSIDLTDPCSVDPFSLPQSSIESIVCAHSVVVAPDFNVIYDKVQSSPHRLACGQMRLWFVQYGTITLFN